MGAVGNCAWCCVSCCRIWGIAGAVTLMLFYGLILTDNVTFERVFKPASAHEAPANSSTGELHHEYETYRGKRAQACLIAAIIYAGIAALSWVVWCIVSRRRK